MDAPHKLFLKIVLFFGGFFCDLTSCVSWLLSLKNEGTNVVKHSTMLKRNYKQINSMMMFFII